MFRDGSRRRLWLAAIPLVMIAAALTTSSLPAQAGSAWIFVAGPVVPGGQLEVFGEAFPRRTTIQLRWDGSSLGMPSLRTNGRGSFSGRISLPVGAQPGDHSLSVISGRAAARSKSPVAALSTSEPGALATLTVTVGAGGGRSSPAPAPTSTPAPTAAPDVTVAETAVPTEAPAVTPAPTGVSTPTPTATPDPTLTPTSPPASTASSGSVWGPALAADSLANTQVGGVNCGCPNRTSAYRFRAGQSSALTSIRIMVIQRPGYGAGTGGSLDISVQGDRGGVPSGTVLASTAIPNAAALAFFPLITFGAPAALTAGELYHIVFRNTDPAPTVNYVSINGLYVARPALGPHQPRYDDADWAQLMNSGSGWLVRPEYTPILALSYANGAREGVGYIEVWVDAYKTISGLARAREVFTVSGGDRLVASASIRLMRLSGSSPLTVRLEAADGTQVAVSTIAASDIPVGTPGNGGGPSTWVTARFAAPALLQAGTTYRLVLSAPEDTAYSVFVIRKGSAYGFPTATYFADGHAQFDPGTGWVAFDPGWTGPLDQGDLQLYLR
jgi:hypothetical protein